jgi:DNA replication licensing factor MCM5
LKIQENPDAIPTGEVPRTYNVVCEKYLVDKMIAGTRVTITGIYTIMERNKISSTDQAGGLKIPYIICLGYQTEQSGSSRIMPNFSAAEKERFRNYSKDPLIYEKIAKSIATSIFGSPDIKKSLACLLFSGSAKKLPD